MPSYTASTPTERPDFVEPGDYEVEVIDAIETISKSGHEMIELKLKTSAGSYLYDFLVFIPTAFWKIDAFRAATGEEVTPDEDVEITADRPDRPHRHRPPHRRGIQRQEAQQGRRVAPSAPRKPATQPQPARRR